MQTRLGSLIESWTNTLVGLGINLAASFVVYPAFGADFSFGQNVSIALIFTVISVIRGYCVRRFFNWRIHRARTERPTA